jgi:hypothetical protein
MDQDVVVIAAGVNSHSHRETEWVVAWILEEKFPLTAELSAAVAFSGSMDAMMALRRYGCPWDENTVRNARSHGHGGLAAWAVRNGCPDPDIDRNCGSRECRDCDNIFCAIFYEILYVFFCVSCIVLVGCLFYTAELTWHVYKNALPWSWYLDHLHSLLCGNALQL